MAVLKISESILVSTIGSFDGDLDGIFRFNNNRKARNLTDFDAFDDVFGRKFWWNGVGIQWVEGEFGRNGAK